MKTSLAALTRRIGRRCITDAQRAWSWVETLPAPRLLALGYLSYIVPGWLVLCLPWSRHPDSPGDWLDHLFTATSAVSTTGLVTVGTSTTYSYFGQAVILVLIQLGGLGYMTVSSCVVLAVARKLTHFRHEVSRAALSLPPDFNVGRFVTAMVVFTLALEAAGAWLLHPVFVAHGAPAPWWQAVFHSVSAFCTAGFGLFNDSFESYRGDVRLNLGIIVLSYLGAIGFIVLVDAWDCLTRKRASLTLTSKIILWSTALISLGGTVLFALAEPSIAALPLGERWLAAWFQVMTASTTVGFNTVPIGALSAASLVLLTCVMLVGASPAGTGGGLKTTSVTALWATMMAVVRRRAAPTFLGKEIPEPRRRAAVANAMFYLLTLAVGVYLIALVETRFTLPDLVFECVSALGTVGLSRGVTGGLGEPGKWIIIALMFLGRVGPLAFGLAFFVRPPSAEKPCETQDVVI